MLCPSCGYENIEGMDRCENCLTPFRDLDVPRPDTTKGLARSVMEDDLRQIELDETITVAPDTSATDVISQLRARHSGCALVVEDNALVGIFTEHDVLQKLTDSEASPETKVRELMSPNPEFLQENDSVASALNKMSLGRYRHVPVRRADGSYSVASASGVLKYIAKEDW